MSEVEPVYRCFRQQWRKRAAVMTGGAETVWDRVLRAKTRNQIRKGMGEGFSVETHFLHDVPPEIAAASADHAHDEADIAFEQPCDFERWPDIPTTVLAGRDDRFFPLEFQRRVARERLGLEVVELPGGHLNALSEPEAVASAVAEASAGRRR